MALNPSDAADRRTITGLQQVPTPREIDIINAARLISRYSPEQCRDPLDPSIPSPSADLFGMLAACAKRWGLTRSELQERARAIWAAADSGWPACLGTERDLQTLETVGSGADVQS